MAIQEALPGRLGPYRLLERIGQGGMGVVHLAADSQNRLVAVKMLRPQGAGDVVARRRLAREVKAMRRVRSPFVAELIDADVTGDVPYLVTRFVAGRTLAEAVAGDGPLRGAPLQRLAFGLASALAAMHAAGVVHRDLKPGNVMMAGDDPVVIDFGIALLADTTPLTLTGVVLGTPGYLAPEVIEGQSSRPSSDVHGWAATVAFAARGEPPYGTGSYETVFYRIVRGNASLDGIHSALYPLIAAALLRQPEQRPCAAWLAGQVARLDLTVPAPLPTSAALAMAASGGAAAATVTPGRMRGLLGKPPLTGDPAPAQQLLACPQPSEVAALLPPVRYAPPAKAGRRHPQQGGNAPAAPADKAVRGRGVEPVPRRHRLLALAALMIAAGISLALPVVGTAAVVTLIATLRAGDRVQTGLAARRNVRGPRAIDAVLLTASAPWALARSILVTILVAPLLLVLAGITAAAAISAAGRSQLPLADAAAGFTVLSCLGPGSRAARAELHRALNAIVPTRLAAATAAAVLGAVAAAAISLALLKAPAFWPVPGAHILPVHLPGASLVHGSVLQLRHIGQGLAHRAHRL